MSYGGQSVVISGDTRFSENLIRHPAGAMSCCTRSSPHHPTFATMRACIDHLARLRTANIEIQRLASRCCTLTSTKLIRQRHIRGTGALAGLITNGYLLNEKRIEEFNDAGLDHLQISIDNVTPDDVSKKSLKVLDAKLQMLARHAAFSVNINSVLGGDLGNPDDALDDREAGDRTGSHGDGRPDRQRPRPPDAADAGAAARLRRDHLADGAVLHGPEPERFPAEPRVRAPERLAVRGGRALSLHL